MGASGPSLQPAPPCGRFDPPPGRGARSRVSPFLRAPPLRSGPTFEHCVGLTRPAFFRAWRQRSSFYSILPCGRPKSSRISGTFPRRMRPTRPRPAYLKNSTRIRRCQMEFPPLDESKEKPAPGHHGGSASSWGNPGLTAYSPMRGPRASGVSPTGSRIPRARIGPSFSELSGSVLLRFG